MGKLFSPVGSLLGAVARPVAKVIAGGKSSKPAPAAPIPSVAAKPALLSRPPGQEPLVDTIGTFTDPAEDKRRKQWTAYRQQQRTILSESGNTSEFV